MNCQAVEETIVAWLSSTLVKSKQNGFVVGVSGGVDSALVSTLCAKACFNVTLLNMPIHQDATQVCRGAKHMAWLKSKYPDSIGVCSIDLSEIFETMRNSFEDDIRDDALAMANLRARLRMSTLYAYAGHLKCLVAGTGNKIEDFGVGFFTKYGDGGVDCSPIGDLSKTQVRELARHMGIDEEIVSAKPTDGLWADNRGDEDQIGATYEELEWAMAVYESYSDKNRILDNTSMSDRQRKVMMIFIDRHEINQHKMIPIPVCKIYSTIL